MDQRIGELVEYAAALRFEDLPQPAVHECKRRIIDSLACAMGAFDEEACRIARSVARRCVGNPPARILGTLDQTTPEHAAFANGVMIRCHDYNDAYFARSSGHPSDGLGAVLAVGEAARAHGRAVITATALSYEAYCNFSDVLLREQGWDYPLHVVVASAAASAKLLGLGAPQAEQAIALAVTPNLPLEQTRLGEISMWKSCAGANAARNGVFAALLAREGLTGPDQAITGRWGLCHKVGRFEWAPFGGRGGPFRITQTHIKYYPSVIHSQSPVTAVLELHGKAAPEDIESIAVETYWVAERYVDRGSPLWHPSTRETADHSIPYIVAVALLDGNVTAESFSEERLRDPRVHALMRKMSLRENPEFTKVHPSAWPCRIEIVTSSGKHMTAGCEYFRGHVRNPLSDAELEAKFRRLAGGRLAPGQIDAALARLWALEQAADIGEVIGLFAVERARA